MISFETAPPLNGSPTEELQIYLDSAGLESLLAQLNFLKDGCTEHVHLFSASWGGGELADEPIDGTNNPVRHVKILYGARADLE